MIFVLQKVSQWLNSCCAANELEKKEWKKKENKEKKEKKEEQRKKEEKRRLKRKNIERGVHSITVQARYESKWGENLHLGSDLQLEITP